MVTDTNTMKRRILTRKFGQLSIEDNLSIPTNSYQKATKKVTKSTLDLKNAYFNTDTDTNEEKDTNKEVHLNVWPTKYSRHFRICLLAFLYCFFTR